MIKIEIENVINHEMNETNETNETNENENEKKKANQIQQVSNFTTTISRAKQIQKFTTKRREKEFVARFRISISSTSTTNDISSIFIDVFLYEKSSKKFENH